MVEVHHIIPQEENGPDTLDNACPLCGSCHNDYGANKEKRKQIREMRDWQWEINAKQRENPNVVQFNEKLDSLFNEFKNSLANQDASLGELKNLLISHNNQANAQIESAGTISGVLAASGIAPVSFDVKFVDPPPSGAPPKS